MLSEDHIKLLKNISKNNIVFEDGEFTYKIDTYGSRFLLDPQISENEFTNNFGSNANMFINKIDVIHKSDDSLTLEVYVSDENVIQPFELTEKTILRSYIHGEL